MWDPDSSSQVFMGSLLPLLFVAVIQTTFEHEFCRCFSVDYKCRHCAGDVWGMVEERNLQLAPPPGVQALDPLLQLQQNLAALNQVSNQVKFLMGNMIAGLFIAIF
jgi:hypothetical protein